MARIGNMEISDISDMLDFLDYLDGRGLIVTDDDLLRQALKEIGMAE